MYVYRRSAEKNHETEASVVDVKILIVKKTFWSNLGKGIDIGNILPQPERQDQINVTAKKRILPPGTFGQNKSVTRIMSHGEEILKNSGLNNPDVCMFSSRSDIN